MFSYFQSGGLSVSGPLIFCIVWLLTTTGFRKPQDQQLRTFLLEISLHIKKWLQ